MSQVEITIALVTHDDADDLPACLESLAALAGPRFRVVVVDCASSDDSPRIAREAAPSSLEIEVVELAENRGFAGGMNEAVRHSQSPWFLTLNADARPEKDYLARLVACAEQHASWKIGALTGRLLRWREGDAPDRLDACGMRLSRAWRHFDRGSGEIDEGQFGKAERVFGATGAASLFRRAALDDVAVDGEVFDADFETYREDAEICFRLRERGWEVVYEPAARARHRRLNVPSRRRSMSVYANYHSLKNRYLLRAYHQGGRNLLLTALPATFRDLAALAWVLLLEHGSLPAYAWLWRHRRHILARRRLIDGRRLVARREIDRWFAIDALPLNTPQSDP